MQSDKGFCAIRTKLVSRIMDIFEFAQPILEYARQTRKQT
jgi:hypothetical protein